MNIMRIVDLPYAYYGIIVNGSTIVNAPPIARWMIGKNISEIEKWVTKKGGDINEHDS